MNNISHQFFVYHHDIESENENEKLEPSIVGVAWESIERFYTSPKSGTLNIIVKSQTEEKKPFLELQGQGKHQKQVARMEKATTNFMLVISRQEDIARFLNIVAQELGYDIPVPTEP